jgi:hypothetical protein
MPRWLLVATSLVLGCANIVGLGPERELVEAGSGAAGAAGGSVGAGGSGGGGGGGGGGAEFACTGDILWARQLGDGSDQVARGLIVGSTGHLFVTGQFSGDLEIDGQTITSEGNGDVFLASFDRQGALRWMQGFGDAADQTGPVFVSPTPDGGVIFAGAFSGTVDFGGGPLTASGEDAFVAKFDDAGGHLWSKALPSPDGQEKVIDAAVDRASGDVVVGGFFSSQIDLGGPSLLTGSDDGFVARYDKNGVYLWSRAIAGRGIQVVQTVDVGRHGRVAIGGSTTADVDLGKGMLSSFGDGYPDGLAALYDRNGNPVWTKVWADSGYESVDRLRFTTDGIVIAGELYGGVSFDGSEPVSASQGMFVAKLSGSGDHVSSRALQNLRHVRAFAVDGESTLVAGQFIYQTDTESGPINAVGGNDGIVFHLTASVDYGWTLPVGSPDDEAAHGISVDASSNVYVAFYSRADMTIPGCGTFENRGGYDFLLLARRP